MNACELRVDAALAGQRLDQALAALTPELGLRGRRRLIARGAVLVNGRVGDAGCRLRPGDVLALRGTEDGTGATPCSADMPRLLSRQGDYCFLYKPAGLHSAALAGDNGIDAEQLQKTIDAYNQAADAGEAIPALEYELAAAKATKVETAPFYIEKVTLRTFGTIPGIEVNDNCQVLDGEGQVVEGLYASGELIAGNAFTRQYPGVGIGVSFAANSGRFAAETAAEGL